MVIELLRGLRRRRAGGALARRADRAGAPASVREACYKKRLLSLLLVVSSSLLVVVVVLAVVVVVVVVVVLAVEVLAVVAVVKVAAVVCLRGPGHGGPGGCGSKMSRRRRTGPGRASG